MAVEPYTPDPVAGAATDALGHINRYNDQEPVRATLANFPDEQIIDWVAYIKGLLVILTNATAPFNKHTPSILTPSANDTFDATSQIFYTTEPTGARVYAYDDTTPAPDGFEWTIGIYDAEDLAFNEVSIRRDPVGSPTQPIMTVQGPFKYLVVRLLKMGGRIYLGPYSVDPAGTITVVDP